MGGLLIQQTQCLRPPWEPPERKNHLTLACRDWGKLRITSITTWSSSNWVFKSYLLLGTFQQTCKSGTSIMILLWHITTTMTRTRVISDQVRSFASFSRVSSDIKTCEVTATWPRTFRTAAETGPRLIASLPPVIPLVSLCCYRDIQWSNLGSVIIPLFLDGTFVGQPNDWSPSRSCCGYDVNT